MRGQIPVRYIRIVVFFKIEKCLLRSNLSKRSKKHTHTHTVCDYDVTPYVDTTTPDNKSEVTTSLLAPVATVAILVTCPYDADFCASVPVVVCADAAAAETGAPDEVCPPGMRANAVCRSRPISAPVLPSWLA